MFGKTKRWIIALAATAALTTGAVGTVALAQTPVPTQDGTQATTQRTDYRAAFLGRLAALLGIDQQKLVDTAKQAGKDTIDEAVKNGDLAQARADLAKQRIDEGGANFGFPGHMGFGPAGGRGKGGMMGPGGPGGAFLDGQVVLKAAADKLGMTVEELQTALRPRKTLSDVAKEKGVALEEVRAAMAAAAKAQLDQAVTDGKLTQQQADAMLERIQEHEGPALGGMRGGPGGPPFRGGRR